MTILLSLTASAQSALDTDFEDGELPSAWTVSVPDGNTGKYSIVKYSTESALKVANVGTNDIGGTYALKSRTGGTKAVKTNSDNWFISPKFTVSSDSKIFSFRFAANCSYSPTVEDENKMQMDIVVIDGENKVVIGSIAPVNYFTWKQYAFDLSSYSGKEIQVAFHDYGNGTDVYLGDMKYIDNIKLSGEVLSDYAAEEITPIRGQALYTQPYTLRITNYGVSTGSYIASYSDGTTTVSETVDDVIASGASKEYTFKTSPSLTPGQNVTFKAWATGEGDAMHANDTVATDLAVFPIQSLPFTICNKIVTYKDIYGEDSVAIENDTIYTEFEYVKTKVTKSSSYDEKILWYYDGAKYHAWMFQQGDSTESNRGLCYLYTTRALSLPKGKIYLTTTGTGTGPDMHYEVYIAKYWDKDLTASPILVGTSDTIPDAHSTTEAFSVMTTELDIPEAGDYTVCIRPLTTWRAQMTIIGYAISTEKPTGIDEVKCENSIKGSSIPNGSACYNLIGQRVNPQTKGLIIRNGKITNIINN